MKRNLSIMAALALIAFSAQSNAADTQCPPRLFSVTGPVSIEQVAVKTDKPNFYVIQNSSQTFTVYNTCDKIRYGAVELKVVDHADARFFHYMMFSDNDDSIQAFQATTAGVKIETINKISHDEFQIDYKIIHH